MTFSRSSSDSEPQPRRARLDATKGAERRTADASADAVERVADDAEEESTASGREDVGDHGTLQPQPRRLDRRLDGESSDPDGAHVCAPTDA